jgi:tRNA nucleotidyltransferase (CCA-adding enzyme)
VKIWKKPGVASTWLCYIIRVATMPEILNSRKIDLDQKLSPEQVSLLRVIAGLAAARQAPLYIVGGCVRDLLLGIPATDLDLVVEGDAISLAQALASQSGGRVTTHLHFGTAQWFPPGPGQRALDFISARSEIYKHNAALPTVKPGTLRDDLVRRDFSINTLAIRLDGEHWGELRDDLGGLDDLRQGQIRVLHPNSFMDDPTRMVRAVRYEQRYGFRIVPETMSMIPPARGLIGLLSAERIRHELDLLLDEEKAVAMLGRLAELDLLQPIHPVLRWNDSIQAHFINGLRRLPQYQSKSILASMGKHILGWHFWLMDFVSIDLESLEQRLHFRANLYSSLLAASALSADLQSNRELKPSQWVARLEDMPLTAVYAVLLATQNGTARQNLYSYLETWRHVKPKTNGHKLMKLGLLPGPRYQQILQRLRNAWLDEEVKTEGEEIKLLDTLTK